MEGLRTKIKATINKQALKAPVTVHVQVPVPVPVPVSVSRPKFNGTYTITFGDVAENGIRMEKIGKISNHGFTIQELQNVQKQLNSQGHQTELVMLSDAITDEEVDEIQLQRPSIRLEEAAVLIIRNGALVLGVDPDKMLEEQRKIHYDTKKFDRGKVKNQKARYNVCFSTYNQEPIYEEKKGRVVDFVDAPYLNTLRTSFNTYLPSAVDLQAEGNYYYNPSKCGIGFHGDAERRKVIAVRLGVSIPLHYQWFYGFKPVGERVKIHLNHGDIYIMSDKAVGNDWRCSSKLTLRHAAGCSTYTTIKPKR